MFKAVFNFYPEDTGYLRLQEGDIITKAKYLGNGWSLGYNINSKQAGLFPRRYVQPVSHTVSAIVPPRVPPLKPEYNPESVSQYQSKCELDEDLRHLNFEVLKKVLKEVVKSESHEHVLLKRVTGFCTGILLGILTYVGCAFALGYSTSVSAVISALAGFMIIIGLMFSTECRAIVALCIPSLCTMSGRFMLSTFAATILLSAPIANITTNTTELASSSECIVSLFLNYFKEIVKHHLQDIVEGIKSEIEDMKSSINSISHVIRPLKATVHQVDVLLSTIGQELNRLKLECTEKLQMKAYECENEMKSANEGCMKFISDSRASWSCGFLSTKSPECQNRKTEKKDGGVCDYLNSGICSPVSALMKSCEIFNIQLNITNVFEALDDITRQLTFNIKAHVTANSTVDEVKKRIEEDMMYYSKIVAAATKYVNMVFSLTVLLVVIKAYTYLKKYRQDSMFDNNYISKGFLAVDNKRKAKGKRSLLPLLPKEKKLTIDKQQCRLSPLEKPQCCSGLFSVFITIAGGVCVILFDYMLYWATLLSNEYGSIKFNVLPNIHLELTDGGLSSYFQSFVTNFNDNLRSNQTMDVTPCLPMGSQPNMNAVIGLIALYIPLFISVVLQAYSLRLRHSIAGYFYAECEKERIRQLHTYLLRKRMTFIREVKDVIRLKKERLETKEVGKNFMDDLKSMAGCYKMEIECFFCEKKERTKDEENYVSCVRCCSTFCHDCYRNTLMEVCPCDQEIPTYDRVTDSDLEDEKQKEVVKEYCYYTNSMISVYYDSAL